MTQVVTTFMGGWCCPSFAFTVFLNVHSCQVLGTMHGLHLCIVTLLTKPQTLEQLPDSKLTVVCEKLSLQPTDHLLDIGCGWGALAAFAHKNYGCELTRLIWCAT